MVALRCGRVGKSGAPAYRADSGLGTPLEQFFRGIGGVLSLECADNNNP
jgi:hypothetical protein